MLAALVIWIIALAVFAYVYWKPGFKNSTQMIRFAPAVKTRPPESRDRQAQAEVRPTVSSTQPS